mgnify:CR=1 FL=1
MAETNEMPTWAGPEVFPAKPESSAYGALSRKGRRSEFESLEALSAHVRSSRESVEAVWTPDPDWMVPPEAVCDLLEPLRQRFVDLAEADCSNARRNSVVDRKSTRLNSSHKPISYAVFCLQKKKNTTLPLNNLTSQI